MRLVRRAHRETKEEGSGACTVDVIGQA